MGYHFPALGIPLAKLTAMHISTAIAWIVSAVTVIAAFIKLSQWTRQIMRVLRKAFRVLRRIYDMALVFFGEHEMMAHDYCMRQHIARHDMQSLAKAVARNAEWRERDNDAAKAAQA